MLPCPGQAAGLVRPGPVHIIDVGWRAQDKRLAWYDLDLSDKPYRALRYHARALRAVAVHRAYPLFASASDDGACHVFHGMVYQARAACCCAALSYLGLRSRARRARCLHEEATQASQHALCVWGIVASVWLLTLCMVHYFMQACI